MKFAFTSFFIFYVGLLLAQNIPSEEENIPFLVTFGNEAPKSWGDDDYTQIFFFVIPKHHKTPFFIRVFDPNIGGKHDESKLGYNSKTTFSVYGGVNALNKNNQANKAPVSGYKSGVLKFTKTFGSESTYDDTWYTFGPLNPIEGDYHEEYGGYIFKVICEGVSGDDGNLYKYYLSSKPNENSPIEGGNAFTYEYTFRLHDKSPSISHIYPFIDKQTVSIKQSNFDFDGDAYIRIVSASKKGVKVTTSAEGKWASSQHDITEAEKGNSLDLQIIKNGTKGNNNVAFYITNQYGKYLPFYTVPIGGVPKYNYSIGVRKKQ